MVVARYWIFDIVKSRIKWRKFLALIFLMSSDLAALGSCKKNLDAKNSMC